MASKWQFLYQQKSQTYGTLTHPKRGSFQLGAKLKFDGSGNGVRQKSISLMTISSSSTTWGMPFNLDPLQSLEIPFLTIPLKIRKWNLLADNFFKQTKNINFNDFFFPPQKFFYHSKLKIRSSKRIENDAHWVDLLHTGSH